jgi:hypothetical protein
MGRNRKKDGVRWRKRFNRFLKDNVCLLAYGFGCHRQVGDQQGEEEWKEAVHLFSTFFSDQVPPM